MLEGSERRKETAMRHLKLSLSVALTAMLVMLAVTSVGAQDIEVVPSDCDYGGLLVGGISDEEIFEVISIGDIQVLEIYHIGIEDDPTSSFTISTMPGLPAYLPPGALIEVGVRFSPISIGPHSANLVIYSSSIYEPVVQIPLSGDGLRYRFRCREVIY
jgi:hypothetical protein